MTNLTYTTTEHYTEEGYTHYTRDILLDETKIGYIDYMVEDVTKELAKKLLEINLTEYML